MIVKKARDLRLDFFRGLALVMIFINHVPGNFLSNFTNKNFGFSDAAEIFVFISGFAATLSYGGTYRSGGRWLATVRILVRAAQLYVAHVLLFFIVAAAVAYAALRFENPIYFEQINIAPFFFSPIVATVQALLLRFIPFYLDILPLYIVLLLIFPLILALLHRSIWVVLIISAGIYVAARLLAWNIPAYPPGSRWFFNPFAWQLLFVMGAVMAMWTREGRRLPRSRLLIAAAIGYLLFAAIAAAPWHPIEALSRFYVIPPKWLPPPDKTNLSLWRLVHFLALAYLTAQFVAANGWLMRSSWAVPLIRCGQHSLHIFCLGSVLAVLGHIIITESGRSLLVQTAVNMAGVGIMFGTAYAMTWYKTRLSEARLGPAPSRPLSDTPG